MKKDILLTIVYLLGVIQLSAQKQSCDIAYRFDAAYSKAFDQLDNVSIFLNQPKPAKEPTRIIKDNLSGPYYYISGATSSKSFQTVDANIGFLKCFLLQPNLELYKAEVINGMRTFTIPSGSNGSHSVNIPIQVLTPPGTVTNGQVNWGAGNFKVKFLSGYLQSGQYILIDKNTISPNGTQIKGYAFSIN
jgi:hypothetical protein